MQANAMLGVANLADRHKIPILHAGDLFDHWDEPVELVNKILDCWPSGDDGWSFYAVPGNHDLPHNGYGQRHRSAFATLVRAGMVTEIMPGGENTVNIFTGHHGLIVEGFPYGSPIPEEPRPSSGLKNILHVALVHGYCWYGPRKPHPGARPEDHASAWVERFKHYGAVVLGDNHESFAMQTKPRPAYRPNVVNPGCLIRRRADERGYDPAVWLMFNDGTFEPIQLNTAGERFRDDEGVVLPGLGADAAVEFVRDLRALADKALDFNAAVERFFESENTPGPVRKFVREILEESRGNNA